MARTDGSLDRIKVARPPGFDPRRCNSSSGGCGRLLADHGPGEFCHTKDLAPPRRKDETVTDETWVDQAARDLGVETEHPCPHCDGTGTIHRPPSKADVCRALLGYQQSARVLVRMLRNPTLAKLRTYADRLGMDIAATVAWCDALAARIEREDR